MTLNTSLGTIPQDKPRKTEENRLNQDNIKTPQEQQEHYIKPSRVCWRSSVLAACVKDDPVSRASPVVRWVLRGAAAGLGHIRNRAVRLSRDRNVYFGS